MNETTRRNLLLAVLVIVVAVVGGRRALDWLGSGATSLGLVRSGIDLEELDGIQVAELRDASQPQVDAELTPGRDPWRFGQRPEPPRPAPTPPPQPPPPEPEPVQAAPVQTEPAVPQPPPVDVTFLGSFGPARRKIAVFDDGETVYNALVGDVVKDKFKVHEIGFESVDLTFIGFPDVPPKRLPIGG